MKTKEGTRLNFQNLLIIFQWTCNLEAHGSISSFGYHIDLRYLVSISASPRLFDIQYLSQIHKPKRL